MKSTARFVIAVSCSLAATVAFAERSITFAEYRVPSTGTIALAVQQNAWEDGAFADVNEITNGALRRAVDAMQFKAESNQPLDLPGLAPFDRVILVGMGSENLRMRAD
jgi:leucyl aminopeptidase